MTESFLKSLAEIIEQGLRRRRGDLAPQAHEIAEQLLSEALGKGDLPISGRKVEKRRMTGGNTAEIVAQITLHAPFAFKMDQHAKKLAEEGNTMREIKNRSNLP